MSAIILELLKNPESRAIIVAFFTELFAGIYQELESDPKYKANFLSIASELKNPNLTVEERSNVLLRLQSIHPGTSGG